MIFHLINPFARKAPAEPAAQSAPQPAPQETFDMNWLSICLGLLPGIIHGIQSVVGDKASGATKAQMAQDALSVATGAAGTILTGSNATYATAASQIASLAINQTVAIAKANGTYQKATAIAAAAQQDVSVAAAVTELVKSVQTPAPPPAPPVAG